MNDIVSLNIPHFARLADWFGIWCMEPQAMAGHISMLRSIDLVAHMRETEPPKMESTIEKIPARNGQSLAIVKIMGTMMKSASSMGGASTVQLRRDVRQAAADPEVSGILLAIDSPGGTVAGTDDLAADVRAARRQKPVYAHIDDMGASAAYWIASQAEKIYANSSTALAGSIGTMSVVYDLSKAADANGVKALLFATGPLKGAGTEGTAVTEEQRAYFQELTDQMQTSFDRAVKNGRGLTDKQLSDVRSGAVFTASNALDRKLIDGIQPLNKTVDELIRVSMVPRATASGLPMSMAKQSLPMARQSLPMAKQTLPMTGFPVKEGWQYLWVRTPNKEPKP